MPTRAQPAKGDRPCSRPPRRPLEPASWSFTATAWGLRGLAVEWMTHWGRWRTRRSWYRAAASAGVKLALAEDAADGGAGIARAGRHPAGALSVAGLPGCWSR
ncbi:hypothetical protein DSL92_06720 [Billgrantia gudaonensis]|uniref:Uncharacterized protein n=1 Tax=Billgrantia gudaonensis TaxID=376427 RepID=A0A432JII9_9GAMM|nr:hypothetical protein DSL92_06720 [Halomonas gudaonensis]